MVLIQMVWKKIPSSDYLKEGFIHLFMSTDTIRKEYKLSVDGMRRGGFKVWEDELNNGQKETATEKELLLL